MDRSMIVEAVSTRARVRVSKVSSRLGGVTGIILGHRPGTDDVKVGMVDDGGSYTGEWTLLPRTLVHLVD